MDKLSMKILKLLNSYSTLNWYQFQVLIPFINIDKFGDSIVYLQQQKFVKKVNLISNNDEEDNTFTFDTFFEITLLGKQYLENHKEENKKFKIQSIYVPIIVALITSVITTLITVWLSK